MDKKEKTGVLNVRDLVNVGLFSVLIFIATFLSGMIGFIPVLMPVVTCFILRRLKKQGCFSFRRS